jgi:hypothetical protein
MKRILFIGLLAFLSVWFVGCAYTRSPYINSDLVNETWRGDLDRNPAKWAQGSDRWFVTGDPNVTERRNENAPYSTAMSTMQVKVPNFTNIVSHGDFEVQVFGTYGDNSVYVYGANEDVRETTVAVHHNTLILNQTKNAKRSMRNVIIRVGVHNLNKLEQMGCGMIEAIQISSSHLVIHSAGAGNIYMSGNINLAQVENKGPGSISVFGVQSPKLDILAAGKGSVNIAGNVGVHSITHHGKGDVNIVGANTDSLTIDADGSGKIGVVGISSVNQITARDNVSVLIDCVSGGKLYVYATNKSRVGLMGNVNDLYMYSSGVSVIYGRYMYSQNTYAEAKDGSHINASAANKIFASAIGNSSVYFFGEPRLMSQFVANNGVVIPVWTNEPRRYAVPSKRVYKDAPPVKNSSGAVTYSYQAYRGKWVNGQLVN